MNKVILGSLVSILAASSMAFAGNGDVVSAGGSETHKIGAPETGAMLGKLMNASGCFYGGMVSVIPVSNASTLTRIDGEKVLYVFDVPRNDGGKISFKIQLSADGKRVEYYKKDVYEINTKNIGTVENPKYSPILSYSASDSNECIGDENIKYANGQWPKQGF